MLGGGRAVRQFLATHHLLRDAHRRSDEAWLKQVLTRDSTVVHLCGLHSTVVRNRNTHRAFVTRWKTLAGRVTDAEPIFLGTLNGAAHFAVALERVEPNLLKNLLGSEGDVLSLVSGVVQRASRARGTI